MRENVGLVGIVRANQSAIGQKAQYTESRKAFVYTASVDFSTPSRNETMDHRNGKRVNVEMDVLFYRHGLPLAAGTTRNVSAGGAFVETNYRPKAGNRYVEFAFVASDETETGVYHVKGLVVHTTPDGTGLMIEDFDPESRLPTHMFSVERSQAYRGNG